MFLSPTQRGLSLIELLIGLVVFGILILAATPSYTAWMQNTKIRNAAESVANGLQLARAEAIRQNTNVEFVLGPASEWTVRIASTGTAIQSRSLAGSVGVTLTPTPSGATTVAFNSLGRPVDPAASLTSILFDVPDTLLPADKSRELRVNVSAGGGIRMCDPNAQDTKTRKDTRVC